jgi:hypothetical protein
MNNPINKWANDLNGRFLKKVHKDNKYMKKCSWGRQNASSGRAPD